MSSKWSKKSASQVPENTEAAHSLSVSSKADGKGTSQSDTNDTETFNMAREPGPAGFDMTSTDSSPSLNCFRDKGFRSTDAISRSTRSPSCFRSDSISTGSNVMTENFRTKSRSMSNVT